MRTTTLKNELNRVVGSCKDSATIYMAAAEHTKSEELQNTFLLFALQRRNFVERLQSEALKSGIRFNRRESLFKQFRQYFKSLSMSFSSGKDEQILASCRDCEEALIDLYDDVLGYRDFPISIHNILLEHQQLIRSTRDQFLLMPAHG